MNDKPNTSKIKNKDTKDNTPSTDSELKCLMEQLVKSRSQTEHDLNLARNALKFLELEWYELRDIALKQTVSAPTLKEEILPRNINHDDAIGINSKELLSVPIENFSNINSNFVASEEETDEDN